MGVFYTFPGLSRLLAGAPGADVFYEATATFLTTSPNITLLLAIPDLEPGDLILSPLFPAGTKVLTVVGTAVVADQDSTGPGAGVPLFFVGPAVLTSDIQLDLLTGVIPQTTTTTYAEVTVATYDGYAPVTPLTWESILQDGTWAWVLAECQQFIPADYTVPNTITGMAYSIPGVGAGPRILLATEVFVAPIVLAAPGQGVQVMPVLPLPFDCTGAPPSPVAA